MMERYISIYRNLLAKSILTIDYSNPASSSELPPPLLEPPGGVCEPALGQGALHTIEHLAATYLRNNPQWADRIVYWGLYRNAG